MGPRETGRRADAECQWGRPQGKAATQRPRRFSSPPPRVTGPPTRRPRSQESLPPAATPSGPSPLTPVGLACGPVPPSWAPPAPPLRPLLRRSRRPPSQRQAETAAQRALAGRAQEIPARFRGSAAAAAARGVEGGGPRLRRPGSAGRAPDLGARRPGDAAGPRVPIPAWRGRWPARSPWLAIFCRGHSASHGVLRTQLHEFTSTFNNRSVYARRSL